VVSIIFSGTFIQIQLSALPGIKIEGKFSLSPFHFHFNPSHLQNKVEATKSTATRAASIPKLTSKRVSGATGRGQHLLLAHLQLEQKIFFM
jgi:hypothetical protein